MTINILQFLLGGAIFGTGGLLYWWKKRTKSFLYSSSEHKKEQEQIVIEYAIIPRAAIGAVLGKQGSVIQKIEVETKVFLSVLNSYNLESTNVLTPYYNEESGKFEFSSEFPFNPTEHAFIKLKASNNKQIKLAYSALKNVLVPFFESRVEKEIDVPTEAVGFVIGSRGKNLKRIAAITKVRINVCNEPPGKTTNFAMYGSDEGVNVALREITKSVTNFYQFCKTPESELEKSMEEFTFFDELVKETQREEDEWW